MVCATSNVGSLVSNEPFQAEAKTSECGVLVVDDDDMIRTLLGTFFRQQDVPHWTAGTGQEALEVFRAHSHEISLVLLDMHLPGWSGPETLANLQQIQAEVRACFMSDDWWPYSEDSLLAMGNVWLINKPFRLETIARMVSTCVEHA